MRAMLFVVLGVLATSAWCADADIVVQAEALVRAGRYADAYALLDPLEDKLAGDLKYDYLLARSALETGHPSRATFIYERILAAEPNYVGVRLEMGQAYLALGDYARAKLEFETVLRFQNLPPGLREQANVYGKAADDFISGKKTAVHGYMELGYGYDSNAQSATRNSVITTVNDNTFTLPPSSLKRSDHYKAFSLGGEVVRALDNRFSAFVGTDLRGRSYNNIDVADLGSADARIGLGYSEGAASARVGLSGGRYWLDYEKTRDNLGLTADYRYAVTKQDQFSVNGFATRMRFLSEALSANNFDLFQMTGGWVRASADGKAAAGLAFVLGKENATNGRDDGDKPFYGARVTLQAAFGEKFAAFFLAGVQRGKYSQFNALFDTTRDDRLYDVTTGLIWSIADGWSLRPQLVYYKNHSNISLFEYDRTDVSLNLRADF
jgi:tetratricopeptide (TPR) repeat protein